MVVLYRMSDFNRKMQIINTLHYLENFSSDKKRMEKNLM